jgi:hypothetical protein
LPVRKSVNLLQGEKGQDEIFWVGQRAPKFFLP